MAMANDAGSLDWFRRSISGGVAVTGVVSLAAVVACGGSVEDRRRLFRCENPNGEAINLGCDSPLPGVAVPVVDLCLRSGPEYPINDLQVEGVLKPDGPTRALLTLTATIVMTIERDLSNTTGEPIDCFGLLGRSFVRGTSERRLVGPDTCDEDRPESRICRCRGRHVVGVDKVPLLRGDNLGGAFYGFDSEIVSTMDGLGCFRPTEGYVDADVIADPSFQLLSRFIIFGGPEDSRTP